MLGTYHLLFLVSSVPYLLVFSIHLDLIMGGLSCFACWLFCSRFCAFVFCCAGLRYIVHLLLIYTSDSCLAHYFYPYLLSRVVTFTLSRWLLFAARCLLWLLAVGVVSSLLSSLALLCLVVVFLCVFWPPTRRYTDLMNSPYFA